MIPSAVAHEVARALQDFLATSFGPSNPHLAHVLDDFLAEEQNLVKGPYLFGGTTSRARCAIWWWTSCAPSTGGKTSIWRT